MCWHTVLIPTVRRRRQVDLGESEGSLVYKVWVSGQPELYRETPSKRKSETNEQKSSAFLWICATICRAVKYLNQLICQSLCQFLVEVKEQHDIIHNGIAPKMMCSGLLGDLIGFIFSAVYKTKRQGEIWNITGGNRNPQPCKQKQRELSRGRKIPMGWGTTHATEGS